MKRIKFNKGSNSWDYELNFNGTSERFFEMLYSKDLTIKRMLIDILKSNNSKELVERLRVSNQDYSNPPSVPTYSYLMVTFDVGSIICIELYPSYDSIEIYENDQI